jgi:hypothetical protein
MDDGFEGFILKRRIMKFLTLFLYTLLLGSFVQWNYLSDDVQVELTNTPLYVGTASWYDYDLEINWQIRNWSKTHNTCAMRNRVDRYKTFKVCSRITWKCVDCYLNDYWPQREDRIIDLSSHAFKELGIPLSRGLTEVEIYLEE